MKRMPHDTVAIVPARGGSKRIPRKNIRPFLGKPILARVLEQLRAADCFDEVMVSTDDEEIAQLARASGAAVPFMRSRESSGDEATTVAVLLEVMAAYERGGRRFAQVCCIYPTAVFITPPLLHEGLRLLRSAGADCVLPVLRFASPIERAFRVTGGRLEMVDPRHSSTRTADLPPAYHDAGQFYWLRAASLLAQKAIYMRHAVPLLLDEMQAQDINTEEDWRTAEAKFALLRERR